MDSDSGGPGAWRARGGVPIITNPPWKRDQLHALIGHFTRCAPFRWLLFGANWAHTRQSRDLIQHCSRILPIGRVRWIPGSPYTGKDDASWYRFEQAHEVGPLLLPFRCDNGTNQTRPCEKCGTPYKVLRADTRFCSNACRQRAYRDRIAVTVTVTEDARLDGPQLPSSFLTLGILRCEQSLGAPLLGFIRVSNLVFKL
jgi:hypothetical protein